MKNLAVILVVLSSLIATSCSSNPVADDSAGIKTDYLYFCSGTNAYDAPAVVFIKSGSSKLQSSVENHTLLSYQVISPEKIEVSFRTFGPEAGIDFKANFVRTPIKFSELSPATTDRPFDGLYYVPLLKEIYSCGGSGLHTYITDSKLQGNYTAQFNANDVVVPALNWVIGTNPITPGMILTGVYSIRGSHSDQNGLYVGSSEYQSFEVIGRYLGGFK